MVGAFSVVKKALSHAHFANAARFKHKTFKDTENTTFFAHILQTVRFSVFGLTVRPEPVEGWTVNPLMVRQAHHERLNLKKPKT